MSSQPNDKAPDLPDALVKELLRNQGLPLDAHVKVNVQTTRVRVNPDGTRTVLSQTNSSPVRRRALFKTRRPSKLVAVLMSSIGFAQMAYGMWAGHSDALAASLMHRSESCQLATLSLADASTTPVAGVTATCRVEQAIVIDAYRTTSRSSITYHVVTARPDGSRDNTRLTARGAYRFWMRLRPSELINAQRFVTPGYRLTGKVLALADSAGTAMSRDHPDSAAYPNAANTIVGALLFVLGLVMFVQANARRR